MASRHFLPALLATAAALAAAVPAASDSPAAAPLAPNLTQQVPSDVKIAQINGQWRLGFGSTVTNTGPGYLQISANGNEPTGQPGVYTPMVADQVVQMSDGSTSTLSGIGQMHYVIGGGHEHWHLLDFERYELRSAADPGTAIVKDQKTGFCLADAFTADNCGRNQPLLTAVTEGISVHGSDTYLGYLEGQYLVLDPATTPAGDYLLVNRVNPTGALLESDGSDDAASVRLSLTWSQAGTPSIFVTNTCLASIDCPAPARQPDPQPQPQPAPPAADPVQPVTIAPEPQAVPVVPASDFAPATARASLSRSMAGRLVRRAIQKSLRHAPRNLRSRCTRADTMTFRCDSGWRDSGGGAWTGWVRVWYRVKQSQLAWYYDLAATRHPGKRRIVVHSARGSDARIAVFRAADGSLICRRD